MIPPAKIQSKIYLVPENTHGRLYCESGVKIFRIERDSFYLEVDPICNKETGLIIESGEVVYFEKNNIFLK